MTKYSNTTKKPGQYVRGLLDHWRERRALGNSKRPLPTRNKAVNECWKPSLGASKADLAEFHQEEMRLRKGRRRRAA